MKVFFMTFHHLAPQSGISRKILSQTEALRGCGLATALSSMRKDASGRLLRLVDGQVIDSFGSGFFGKIRSLSAYGATLRHIVENDYDAVYLRHEGNATPFLAKLFQQLQARGIRIFVEVPTFPYDGEKTKGSFATWARQAVDRLSRARMFHYADKVVTFVDIPSIFGVPTLTLSNAVDFSKIVVKTRQPATQTLFKFVTVAELQFWHGLDRMIRGIAAFKGDRKILFHIVGDSPANEKETLFALAQQLSVADKVIFHGALAGRELQELMHVSDFAIASLGRHRCGIEKIKTLKNREYAAYGLPFAYSETDEDFEHMPYIVKIPADESAVDLASLIAFHDALAVSPQEIRASIESTLSWGVQMRKVAEALGQAAQASECPAVQ